MITDKYPRKTYLRVIILLLIAFGLIGCEGSYTEILDWQPTGFGGDESGEVEIISNGTGIKTTPKPEWLTYTNRDYGFEISYPESWILSEEDHTVVLRKGPNRLGIRYRWIGEWIAPDRTGISAGELIYSDKVRIMGDVIPAEVLQYECKNKAVFYGGTGQIEIDDLSFAIELADLETANYSEIDLSEELMAEAKLIVESLELIDEAGDPAQGTLASKSGLTAHLEIPERLPIGESINLKFVLKNVSDEPLYVLEWYTPLEGIAGEIFRVKHDGQTLPYEGILASRMPPSAEQYILLYPGETVSAVVNLANSFDFSEVGQYRIKFISPGISHIARTEDEMASTMEELGPVEIPSNEVFLELVESINGDGYSQLRTPDEAEEMIESYLREKGLDLGIEPILPVEELHVDQLWRALQAQVFKVLDWKFINESFLIWGSNVIQLGTAQGGQGLTSLVVADIDQNGQAELFYTYSFGSDVQQSRIGMFSTAYQEEFIVEADIGYYGHLGVYSEDGSHVGVRVIEVDQDQMILRYQNPFGYLFIEQDDGKAFLGLKMFKIPPQEILEKLLSLQNSPQN